MKYTQPNILSMVISSLLYMALPVVMVSVIVEKNIDYIGPLFITIPFWISLLILPLYVFLFRRGWLSVLFSVKLAVFLNVLVLILVMNYEGVVNYLLEAKESDVKFELGLNFIFIGFPVLLILSAHFFIFYGKKVGSHWMLGLALFESLFIYTIPFIWIPMIIYYPLMKRITLKYRLKLIKEKRIHESSRQSFKKYKQVIWFFYGPLILGALTFYASYHVKTYGFFSIYPPQ